MQRVTWVEGVDIDDNDVASRTYVDLNASYELNDQFVIYTGK